MRLLDDDGAQLDAEFDIEVADEGVHIVLRARSGARLNEESRLLRCPS